MSQYEPDESAERVGRYRRHNNGDHSQCLYVNCPERREIEAANECHLCAIAVFSELADQHLDAHAFFGEGYEAARELAETDFPDWLPGLDFMHRLMATVEVRAQLADQHI